MSRKLASKALTIANALRSLGNTVRGVNPYLMQQAVTTCALRKVYFGAEAWWSGRAHPGPRTGSISNQVQGHLGQITKVILAGARAIIHVYRTTPIAVLHREKGSKNSPN
jgi:hypothetical protein